MGRDKSLSDDYEQEEAMFKLGRIVVDPEAQGTLNPDDVQAALQYHSAGHWGQVDTLTRMEQDETIATGAEASVISVYFDRDDNEFWVTTNAERTVTSVSVAPDFEQSRSSRSPQCPLSRSVPVRRAWSPTGPTHITSPLLTRPTCGP